MNYKSLLSNAGVAIIAQGVTTVLSVVISLLVPKVLGVEQFGYWQLFILYMIYTPLATFGVNDGLYLLNGGRHRDELDKRSIGSQFFLLTAVQLILVVLAVILVPLANFGVSRTFVIVAAAIYMPIYCGKGFIGYLFQAINETKLFSVASVIGNVLFLVPLAVLLVMRVSTFQWYVVFYCLGGLGALMYCFWKGWDLVWIRPLPLKAAWTDMVGSARVGVKLLFANLAALLIMGVMRFVIDGAWDITTFGEVSFSLTLANFFLVFVNQVSMVLFPELRRAGRDELVGVFARGRDMLEVILPLVYVGYFPVRWLMGLWLPQYAASLVLFALFLPVCLFDGKMSLIGGTFLKVLRKEAALLRLNVLAVVVSTGGALFGGFVLHSIHVVILSAVMAIIVRSALAEWLVAKSIGGESKGGVWLELAFTAVFMVLATVAPWTIAVPLVLLCYAGMVAFHWRRVLEIVARVRGMHSRTGRKSEPRHTER